VVVGDEEKVRGILKINIMKKNELKIIVNIVSNRKVDK